jgi:hypothetical protein
VCVNGDPGVRIDATDRPLALIALEQIDGTIVSVRIMNNPEKLTRLKPHPRPLLR